MRRQVARMLRRASDAIDPTGPAPAKARRARKNRGPEPAGFVVCIGDAALPAYWLWHYPVLAFAAGDVAAAFGAVPEPRLPTFVPAGFVEPRSLLNVVDFDQIGRISHLVGGIKTAFDNATTWSIAARLALTSDRLADGLRLNTLDIGGDERNRILARKYPDFDPQRDDIWHATHRELWQRRRQSGFSVEFDFIQQWLVDNNMVVA